MGGISCAKQSGTCGYGTSNQNHPLPLRAETQQECRSRLESDRPKGLRVKVCPLWSAYSEGGHQLRLGEANNRGVDNQPMRMNVKKDFVRSRELLTFERPNNYYYLID